MESTSCASDTEYRGALFELSARVLGQMYQAGYLFLIEKASIEFGSHYSRCTIDSAR
jgi:hypothetical protein